MKDVHLIHFPIFTIAAIGCNLQSKQSNATHPIYAIFDDLFSPFLCSNFVFSVLLVFNAIFSWVWRFAVVATVASTEVLITLWRHFYRYNKYREIINYRAALHFVYVTDCAIGI